ncbi:BREX system ATP-binding domain-containing protein [Saliphagus sp. GCM10025317]
MASSSPSGDDRPDLDRRTASNILNRISNGMPPEPEHIEYVRVGREAEEHEICEDGIEGMESLRYGNGQIFFVLGDFGYGKSFFINLIAENAFEKNLARSELDIPDVGNLSDKTEFYKKAVQNVRLPDERGSGLAQVLRKFCDEFDRDRLEETAARRGFLGHSIYTILDDLLQVRDNGSVYVERDEQELEFRNVLSGAIGYLEGKNIALPEKHAIGKKGYDRIGNDGEDEYEYLKHIRSLIVELGYEGFVVLIDEVAEEMDWNPDDATTQRLIDLFNKSYQKDQFSRMMFVFVGNAPKWDSLIEETGHGALTDRYNAKKLELSPLTKSDYENLIHKVAWLVSTADDVEININASEASEMVDTAIRAHGGESVSALSPRRLLLEPEGQDGPNLITVVRRYK